MWDTLRRAAGHLRRRRERHAAAGSWLADGRILACAYPRHAALAALAARGITVMVNLHQRPHDPMALSAHGLREVHLPVRDFTPPTPAQIEQAMTTIQQALADGDRVAVHCGAGLGRTGTILACYLVAQGSDATAAIAEIRRIRPGAVETTGQVAAVAAYAAARGASGRGAGRPPADGGAVTE